MNKKYFVLFACLVIFCTVLGVLLLSRPKKTRDRIYLSDEYYSEEVGDFIKTTVEELESLDDDTYLLYIYNDYCKFPIPCDQVFEEFMKAYHIHILSLPFVEFKETSFYPEVKYAPSIILIQKGKIVTYLDANSDKDVEKYQKMKKLKEWLGQYIYLENE